MPTYAGLDKVDPEALKRQYTLTAALWAKLCDQGVRDGSPGRIESFFVADHEISAAALAAAFGASWRRERTSAAVPDAPRDLLAIVDKAMARDPAARYPSARELAADLRRFQTGQLVGAREYSRLTRLRRWIAHHRAAVLVGAILSAALAVTGAVSAWRIVRERDRAEARSAELVVAEARAVRQRRAAEELVDFMLGEQRTSLEKLGKLRLDPGFPGGSGRARPGERLGRAQQQQAVLAANLDLVVADLRLQRGSLGVEGLDPCASWRRSRRQSSPPTRSPPSSRTTGRANVRELRNAIERVLAFAPQPDVITRALLGL